MWNDPGFGGFDPALDMFTVVPSLKKSGVLWAPECCSEVPIGAALLFTMFRDGAGRRNCDRSVDIPSTAWGLILPEHVLRRRI